MSYVLEGPKWSGSSTVTWSFAAPGGSFTDAISGAYQSTIEAALAEWSKLAGVTFVQQADSASVDIRIGWGSFSGSQVGETDYSYQLGAGEVFVPGVTVRLEDPADTALSSAAGAYWSGTSTTLYEVALHEIGHALGLAHTTDANAIMYPTLGPSNSTPDATDIAGIQALYGAGAAPAAAAPVSIPAAIALPGAAEAVYRFFDTQNGTQFLTADVNERNTVISTRPDLVYEGLAFPALASNASDPGAVPVYRFFNATDGSHFYTDSASEMSQIQASRPDMVSEGVAFYADTTPQAGDVTVYRFFNTNDGTHLYTDSQSEVQTIQQSRPDMVYEGVAFYAPNGTAAAGTAAPAVVSVTDDTIALYSFTDSATGGEFLTASVPEVSSVLTSRPDLIYNGPTLRGVDPNSGDPDAVPVYRFFDTADGSHFFTANATEAAQIAATQPGMVAEGTAFYAHATQQQGDVPVYRFDNTATGSHLFTDSAAQQASISATQPNMVYEGVAFWAPTS